MQLRSAVLNGWVQPADVFVQFFNALPNAFWLDREFHPTERFSVLGSGQPVANLQPRNADYFEEGDSLPFAWRPGSVGVITYEGEQNFIDVDRAIVFDHDAQKLFFLGLFETQAQFEAWHHAALLRLGLSGGQLALYLHNAGLTARNEAAKLRHSAKQYLEMISSAQRSIAAGDVYQICLTNEIEVTTAQDPLLVFLKLRELNPAPFAGYFKLATTTLVCSSPEQFISVSAEGQILSKPIKGTRPRSADPAIDAEIATELKNDAKERAENLMIVDLMRNDIGKVAEVGTVAVPALFEIESYATVHQLVSTVSGKMAAGFDSFDVVLAAFPGGSMTGAPKIRAMEIIQELEVGERGLYSGCFGYLGVDGSAEFAMVIRSIVFENGLAKIGVGGGITIDSNADAELAETQLKARVLLAALHATDPW